jgi:hypothetical protein
MRRRQVGARLAIGVVVGCAALATAAPASAILLDDMVRSSTVDIAAPARPAEPTDEGSNQVTPLDHPNYDNATAGVFSVRIQLNDAANGLGSDIRAKEEAVTGGDTGSPADDTSDTEEEDMSDCLKAALWDIAWDAAWDVSNSQPISLDVEWNQTRDRLINCLGEKLGLGPIAATSLANYLAESVATRASEAIQADPTETAFVDWAIVTSWYSLQGGPA